MTKAIYAFSGDPITYGHIDVVKRASRVFDEVWVAIGSNPDKKYLFSLEERERMARNSLEDIPNVKVVSFSGTLVDFAYENSIDLVVKGIRDSKDFDYEVALHKIGESQKLGIDTFLVPASQDKAHISSSAVKALQLEQGLVQDYVPIFVKQKLEEKISGQYFVGVTGEIGVGKSFVANGLRKTSLGNGMGCHHIELDDIGHDILGKFEEPLYKRIREKIALEFGDGVLEENGFIDRVKLGKVVFEDQGKLQQLNSIMHKAILMRLRREVYGKKGIILLSAALFAEVSITYLCNNNLILVYADEDTQKQRLESKGYDTSQIERRLTSQFDFERKKEVLEQRIRDDRVGHIWQVDNSQNIDVDFTELLQNVIDFFDLNTSL
jgi:pantetheine-phosphate adenylyltransferase/dephospho-CoA kinase